jgi:hypothetical protein
LLVEKIDNERSHWWFKEFQPGKGYWDGTSLLPDKGKYGFLNFDALFKASLFHDVTYKKAEAISKATGIPVEKILAFADDMLKILAEGYGAKKSFTTPIHTIVRFGGSLYHKIKKYLSVIVIAFLCYGLIGCYSVQTEMENQNPPDIHWIGPVFTSLTNDIGHILINPTNKIDSSSIPSVPIHQETSGITPETSHEQTDHQTAQPSIKIVSFGSPNCSKATEDPNTQIGSLKMNKNGLSYRWTKGDLSNWGIKNKHDADALAIAGYGDGNTFKCSKFDWISSDRLTRGFENIYGGYNGFNSNEFFGAKHRCFFIMSKDGKRRTNVLVD